eukprot:2695625-Alexandrium_andersonii.AAC.1
MYDEGRLCTAPQASGASAPQLPGATHFRRPGNPAGAPHPECAARHVVPAHRRAAREVAPGLGAGRR